MKYRIKRSDKSTAVELYIALENNNGHIIQQLGYHEYIIQCSPKVLIWLILKVGIECVYSNLKAEH